MPDEAFGAVFAQNAAADELAVLRAVQRPLSPACITVPVPRPLWKDRPTWFLVAEHDRMIIKNNQLFMSSRMKAHVRNYSVDHTPMVTAPGVVLSTVLEAISEMSAA